MNINKICQCLSVLWLLMVAGCTGYLAPVDPQPDHVKNNRFIIVTPTSQDTLASLARKYLKDEDKAWQIAAFNDIDTLKPGRRVVIPLKSPTRGGIRPDGYQTVPVLLYTRLAAQPTNAHTVSTGQFRQQLRYLEDHGYTTMSLTWLQGFLDFREQPPNNAIVISFDTTQRWVYDIAYPMLKQHKMRGAVFIRTADIGKKGNLTWNQLSEMSAGGFDIGIHGSGTDIQPEKDLKGYLKALEAGLTEPQKDFKRYLKRKCRHYAFSGGVANDLVIALLKKHGYQSAFTRIRGSNPFFMDAFHIRRSLIYGHYKMDKFRRNLATFNKASLK